MPRSRLVTFTTSGTWTKDPKLYAIKIVGRGPGGGGSWPAGNGNGYGGGGGGASKTQRRIAARELPDTVDVVIGPPGIGGKSSSRNGTNGGDCSFGTFLRVGGGKGATTTSAGAGGDGVDRGGNGGTPGSAGQSKPLRPSDYLRAPGGGAGGGSTGGSSGVVPAGQSSPTCGRRPDPAAAETVAAQADSPEAEAVGVKRPASHPVQVEAVASPSSNISTTRNETCLQQL